MTRDKTGARRQHPRFHPERCVATSAPDGVTRSCAGRPTDVGGESDDSAPAAAAAADRADPDRLGGCSSRTAEPEPVGDQPDRTSQRPTHFYVDESTRLIESWEVMARPRVLLYDNLCPALGRSCAGLLQDLSRLDAKPGGRQPSRRPRPCRRGGRS